jgi:hypothetical protein
MDEDFSAFRPEGARRQSKGAKMPSPFKEMPNSLKLCGTIEDQIQY